MNTYYILIISIAIPNTNDYDNNNNNNNYYYYYCILIIITASLNFFYLFYFICFINFILLRIDTQCP